MRSALDEFPRGGQRDINRAGSRPNEIQFECRCPATVSQIKAGLRPRSAIGPELVWTRCNTPNVFVAGLIVGDIE